MGNDSCKRMITLEITVDHLKICMEWFKGDLLKLTKVDGPLLRGIMACYIG